MTHHPMYCTPNHREPLKKNKDCQRDTTYLQGILEDMVYQNGVDFYITGHLHNYERDAPIYRNVTIQSEIDKKNYYKNPQAPIHIVSGAAGNDHEHNDPLSPTPSLWNNFYSLEYGSGRMIIYNSTHALWE